MTGIGHNSQNYVSVESLSKPQREKLKSVIKNLNDSMTRTAAERDYQKEAIKAVSDELGVDKKIVRRMAKAYFVNNYREVVEENEKFQTFYETVMEQTL